MGILKNIWGKSSKQEEPKEEANALPAHDDFDIPVPEFSAIGGKCRTLSYKQADGADETVVYRKAVENPQTRRWSVFNVMQSADLSPEDQEPALHIEPLSGATNVSYFAMIQNLATFENSQNGMGYTLTEDDTAARDDYFRTLARKDLIAFDDMGQPHPTLNGEIVTAGTFKPSEQTALEENSQHLPQRKPLPALATRNFSTKYMREFENGKALGQNINVQKAPLDNLHTLQDKIIKVRYLEESLKILTNDVRKLSQKANKFKRENKSVKVWSSNYRSQLWMPQSVHGPKVYEEKIDKLKQRVTMAPLLSEEDKEHIKRFLDNVSLFTSITWAKLITLDCHDYQDYKQLKEEQGIIRQKADALGRNEEQSAALAFQSIALVASAEDLELPSSFNEVLDRMADYTDRLNAYAHHEFDNLTNPAQENGIDIKNEDVTNEPHKKPALSPKKNAPPGPR